ncbi:hypothetical protein ACVWXB_007723 [Streptomyces sp. TE12347]
MKGRGRAVPYPHPGTATALVAVPVPVPVRELRSARRGQARGMTSHALDSLALTPAPGPAWLHLAVIAFALLVLLHSLARHR